MKRATPNLIVGLRTAFTDYHTAVIKHDTVQAERLKNRIKDLQIQLEIPFDEAELR